MVKFGFCSGTYGECRSVYDSEWYDLLLVSNFFFFTYQTIKFVETYSLCK